MSKKCTPLWRKAHFEVSMLKKTRGFGPLLEAQMSTPLWREAHFEVKMLKHQGFGPLLDAQMSFRVAGVGHLKRICIDAFSVAGTVQKTCSWEMLGGQGAHQICRFAKILLRDRCNTSYDLASIFRGRRTTSDRWSGKIAKRIGVLHSPFHFWRSLAELFCFWCCQIQKLKKSRRIASFWMLPRSKNEEVSQNCFVLGVVMCKN